MNWYKKAALIDDIKRFGPGSRIDFNDPEDAERIKYIADLQGMTPEQLQENINSRGGWDEFSSQWKNRDYFSKQYGWSVPNQEAIDKIKQFVGSGTIIEVGSGKGTWAKLIQDAGINVIATDAISGNSYDNYSNQGERFTDVEDLDGVAAAQKYGGSGTTLMMSWPPYADPFATNVMKSFQGDKLIFVGEGYGGCTADEEFFDLLGKEWNGAGEVDIPQWEGIHDYLTLYTRK